MPPRPARSFLHFLQRGTLTGASFVFILAAQPQEAAPDSPSPATIRVVSWNVRNFTGTTPPDSSRPRPLSPKPREEVSAVVRTLASAQPDIVGLSEMGSEHDLQRLQEMLAEEGITLQHRELVSGADPVRHLAVLSRFPIASRQHETRLSYQLGTSRFPVQRGILDVTIQPAPHWQLRLCGVHLKSRRDTPEAEESLMRRNEAHLLRSKIDDILRAGPETPLLLFGDFNDSRDSPSLRSIRGIRANGRYLAELPCADDRGERWTYHFPEADAYSRIDFLLASRSLRPAIADADCRIPSDRAWRLASDHRPLATVIRIPVPLDPARTKAASRGRQ